MQKNLATIGAPARAGDGADAWAIQAAAALRNELPRLRYALIEVKLENLLRRLAPAVGRDPAALHRWPRARDGALEIPSLASLRSNIAALRFQLVLCQFAWRERKAGFDPNQPRVPRGQPDGGQWSDAGGSSDAGGGSDGDSGSGGGDRAPLRITIHPRSWYEDSSNSSSINSNSEPIGDPPIIHPVKPLTVQLRNRLAKRAAIWLLEATLKEVAIPVIGTFLDILDAALWIHELYPYIQAYLEPPKTLGDLQSAVAKPAKGYEMHHIAEQGSATKDNFPRSLIHGDDNLVRIPTFKHHQITGWYMTPGDRFQRMAPREFLRGKSWEERQRIGHEALVRYRVLKP